MEYREVGKSGLRVSEVCLGTMTFGNGNWGCDEGVSGEILDGALARPQPPSARAALLTRRGRLLSSDPERALEAAADYREALSLGPARNDVRQALRSLLESSGQWDDVLD